MNTHNLKHSSRARLLTSLLATLLGLNFFQLVHLAMAAATNAGSNISLKLIAEGLNAPTVLASIPDGSGRLLVADQPGVIHLLDRDGKKSEQPFLDLRSKIVALGPRHGRARTSRPGSSPAV
jgi:hypothetical protein